MSMHSDRSFAAARRKGAAAAVDYRTWSALMALSKRELAEIAMHLAGICTDSYDDSFRNGAALARVFEERDSLRENGII